ncbi:MAG: HAD family hydrolase [Bacteroidales bacterium]|jgi:putative hydrolase of the HAD superfamily|nr:HAD family hydrolase [Bacteroidales bacterium]MDD3272812.1 HAD family hydrolase [Bacteroidales bacterium]MDD4058437.1 HAD family hydrolase [Bacteroidales bacterium]
MEEIKLIAFDADDTLWMNEYHYRKAELEFCEKMQKYTSAKTANELLLKREKQNLPLLGYGSKPFIISLIETAIEISNGEISTKEILELIEIGKETIGQPIELMPDVENVLSMLSLKFPLILATKGDLKEQESKIERSGLEKYFTSVEILSEKSSESYRRIIQKHSIKPENFLMVGNSFKSDILPVLEIGGNAIYIPSEIIWAHEIAQEIEHPRLKRADRLSVDLFV